MKVKTSELQGAALDWAVAKCEGRTTTIWGYVVDEFSNPLRYHDDWGLAGSIIERFQENETTFCLFFNPYRDCPEHGNSRPWSAEHRGTRFSAETPLIAAMRCYVASKLGNEVDIPDEITQLGETK